MQGSLADQIKNFNKQRLAPTETIERHLVAITGQTTNFGHSADEDIQEYYDSEEELNAKIEKLVDLIKSCNHVVVYTGAGISTSAKIPDYRGPQGKWTMMAQGLAAIGETPKIEQAIPTTAHMAVSELVKQGICKCVISTNLDGLHRRSGVPVENLAELHGNCFKENCAKCGKEYLRTFDVVSEGQRADHLTGRLCDDEDCKGQLKDNIVNFGEYLPQDELYKGQRHATMADLVLVLGSSLTVRPACDLPLDAQRFVIVNLQVTPHDGKAEFKIHAKCDDAMTRVMKGLGLTIPNN